MTHRILFAFVGGRGHLEPLLPIAHAARAAGHEVAMAADAWMVDAVTAAGLPTLPVTPHAASGDGDEAPSMPTALLVVDRAREEADLREKFVRDAGPRRAARMLEQAAAWRPDVIVTDEADVGTVVAAERLGIRCATVIVLAAGGFLRQDVVGEALDELRTGLGLAGDPELRRMRGDLVIDPTPPGYRDPADPLRGPVVRVRLTSAAPAAAPDAGSPPWPVTRPGRPAVYVTLGTVFNLESGDLFQRVLEAVVDHDGDVLVTVGRDLDPTVLGPRPAHVHVERFVPQAAVLPHVAAVVSHGGSGSVLGALAHGRPMVLLPMGADQPWNGDRCAALGVARVLDPVTATTHDIAAALREIVGDSSYATAATAQQDALAALPGPDAAVAAIAALAAGQPG